MPQYRLPVQFSASLYASLRELARWSASSLWTYLTPKSSTTGENAMVRNFYAGIHKKKLSKYNHPTPKRPQHAPYPCAPKPCRKLAHEPIATDNSPPAGQEGITHVQKVVGSILYYARSVDSTPLVALNTLASEQAHEIEKTIENMKHMLYYLATNLNATVRFYPSDMILNVHSDASYLSAKKRQESCSWPFLPRLATRRQTTHPPERANPNALHDPQVCRSIRGGIRIRSNVFKRKRSENNQIHTQRARPPATTYPHALR